MFVQKIFAPHPSMSSDEIRERTQKVWDRFYNWSAIWQRSACTPTLRARVAFMFLSKLYRQMYAGTGISTDRPVGRNPRRGHGGRPDNVESCFKQNQCHICSLRRGNSRLHRPSYVDRHSWETSSKAKLDHSLSSPKVESWCSLKEELMVKLSDPSQTCTG